MWVRRSTQQAVGVCVPGSGVREWLSTEACHQMALKPPLLGLYQTRRNLPDELPEDAHSRIRVARYILAVQPAKL